MAVQNLRLLTKLCSVQLIYDCLCVWMLDGSGNFSY